MCFALLALNQHPDYPFILAANRDEFLHREAQPLHAWSEPAGVVGGRDLSGSGSWLLFNQLDQRFVLVTNVRNGQSQVGERSRGLLVKDLADARVPVEQALATLTAEQDRYAGFNVLAGYVGGDVYFFSNRDDSGMRRLSAGLYGLSNATLDTPWPKVVRGKAALSGLLQHTEHAVSAYALFALLADRRQAADEDLPDTGIGLEKERWLSPLFITGEHYSTRCSSVILAQSSGIQFFEKNHDEAGVVRVLRYANAC